MTGRQYEASLVSAKRARSQLIDLTHELPPDAPQEILRLWNVVDTALFAFICALEVEDA